MAHDDMDDRLSGPSSPTSRRAEIELLEQRVQALLEENVRLRASLGETAMGARQAQTSDRHTAMADRDILLSAIEKTRMR